MMLGVNIAAQTLLFLKSMLLGACLMLLYDCFRILRMAFVMPGAFILVQDVLYFAACAVSTFLFLISANYGEVRAFALLGEILGAVLCALSVSKVVMACSKAIIGLIRGIFELIWRVFLRPIYCLIRWVIRFLMRGIGYISNKLKKSLHKANYSLKVRRHLLYNLCKQRGAGGTRKKKCCSGKSKQENGKKHRGAK